MAKKKSSKAPLKADQRISEVAQRWFLMEPLLFSVYCTHVLCEDATLDVPLRSGQGRIEYNALMIDAMNACELADRLKVEALRILLKHPYQRQPFGARPEILYLASNMTILDNMGGKDAFCFELVPHFIVAEMPAGKTFEEYYALLNRLIPPSEEAPSIWQISAATDSTDATAATDSPDNPDNPNNSPQSELSEKLVLCASAASQWEEDSIMTVDINLIIQAVAAGPSKGWGTLPGNFEELILASLVPPINVANILKRFKKSILSNSRELTRMRPSRRYGFEQMGSRHVYTTRVLVALDVSGSVESDMLSRMLAMINRIFKQGVKQIDVIQFDAELAGPPEPIRKTISTFKVIGRGGTDFQPAADYYITHPEYDGLIYITDGQAPDPKIPKKFSCLPVTWLITNDSLIPTIHHGWKISKK